MDGGGFIRELCLALEHRWIPEQQFLLFTAYFDEADTHGRTPTVIMAGFLGTAREWLLFERKLRALQRRDGFSIFHVKELKHKSGEFRGWSDEKCMRLLWDLTAIVRDELTEGLTIHLEHERYISEYRASPTPKGMILDSQYGLCFRACLARLVDLALANGKNHRLNVVIERGHRNARDADRIFNDVKRRMKLRRGIELLGDLTIASKQEREPLMVADFLASSFSMMRSAAQTGGIDYKEEAARLPDERGAALNFLEFNPGSLQKLKEDFAADREEQAKAWRERRDARRASSISPKEQPS